jgi:hypothetical protein
MLQRSKFNVPDRRNTSEYSAVALPDEMPEGHLELPVLETDHPNLVDYLQRPNRWSFDMHLCHLPKHGSGQMHDAIYRAAVAGLAEGKPSAEIHYLLRETAVKKGRPVARADREAQEALINAHHWFSGRTVASRGNARLANRPKMNWAKIREVAFGEESFETFKTVSDEPPATAIDALSAIYKPEDLICLASELYNAQTRSLNEWLARGVADQRLMVANPMRVTTGTKADGRPSARCNDNAGSCKWIVVEFDFREENEEDDKLLKALDEIGRNVLDLGASLHCHLQAFLPLGMVVFSGRSSLHGWYDASGINPEDADRFREYARSLKADPALFVPCQLTRMPWGTRENGEEQSICYFNQEVISHVR